MADGVQIESLEELEYWVETQDARVSQAIATRAALRSLPIIMSQMDQKFYQLEGVTLLLACLHGICASAAVSTCSHDQAASLQSSTNWSAPTLRTASLSPSSSPLPYSPRESATAAAAAAVSSAVRPSVFPATDASASVAGLSVATDLSNFDQAIAERAYTAAYSDGMKASSGGHEAVFWQPLWLKNYEVQTLIELWRSFESRNDPHKTWAFWKKWYRGFLDGKPLDWELQRRIALIADDIWKAGPEAVAVAIREIEVEFASTSADVSETTLFSDEKLASVAQAATRNSHVIALTGAGVKAQVQDFRETVRGRNDLEPDLREDLLELLDSFASKLDELVKRLPDDHQTADHEEAHGLLLWWRDYSRMMKTKAAKYVSAENVSDATLPAGIVLGSTAIGGLLGQPLAGSVVGGLIANQIKPGQAAKELLKSSTDTTTTN